MSKQEMNIANSSNITQNISNTQIYILMMDEYKNHGMYIQKSAENLLSKFTTKVLKMFSSKEYNQDYQIDFSIVNQFISIAKIMANYENEELANQLCDILANAAFLHTQPLSKIVLLQALDTVKYLNKSHLELITFIFLLRNCQFELIKNDILLKSMISDILWEFKPVGLDNFLTIKHLELTGCTSFVNREMTISRMLLNNYLDVVGKMDNQEFYPSKKIRESVKPSYNSNALPEYSRLSETYFNNFGLDRSFACQKNEDSIKSRKGQEEFSKEKKVVDFIKELDDGHKILAQWVTSPIKNHILTSVGMVLAISTLRNRGYSEFKYLDWID